ncbi:MAG TPA: DUF5652 family protein [Candidatus Woesebacteria bacterium]|nr:DUF5652 family protein [Candidatus Woesebacteria bacterium]
MYTNLSSTYSFGAWFYLLVGLDAVLKGITLWKSARKGQTVWFVALLIVNSLGLLPLIYLLIEKYRKPSTKIVIAKKATKKKASKK